MVSLSPCPLPSPAPAGGRGKRRPNICPVRIISLTEAKLRVTLSTEANSKESAKGVRPLVLRPSFFAGMVSGKNFSNN